MCVKFYLQKETTNALGCKVQVVSFQYQNSERLGSLKTFQFGHFMSSNNTYLSPNQQMYALSHLTLPLPTKVLALCPTIHVLFPNQYKHHSEGEPS